MLVYTLIVETTNIIPFPQTVVYDPLVHSGSVYFDGSSYLSVPTANFTFEAWVYKKPGSYFTLYDSRSGANYSNNLINLL